MLGNILIVCAFVQIISAVKLPVCCPLGYQLVDRNKGSFGPSKFECELEKGPVTPHVEEIYGFNIYYSNKSEIPKCDHPLLLINLADLDTNKLSPKSCVTKYMGQFQAVDCPSGSQYQFSEVNIVKKCCPFGKVYDYLKKRCVESDDLNTKDRFSKYFQSPTIFEYFNNLECPADKVIVEYYSEFNNFTFRGNEFYLSNDVYKFKNVRFERGTFCVENVILNQSNIVNDKKIVDHSYVDSDNVSLLSELPSEMFVVRSCNDPKVCEDIPCIRRCCGDNEEYVVANNSRQCVPSEMDLNVMFHSFMKQSGSFESVIPKVYGVHRGLMCPKYVLKPDKDKNDIHYFSFMDGSIFLPNTFNTYSNNHYCIENVVFGDFPENNNLWTFFCFDSNEEETLKFELYPIGILISCAFFTLTLVVYLSIPKLRNLPGKILICLVLSLLIAYLGIACGQISPPSDKYCASFAFFIYFSLLSAFSWMNVMCFDIWLTFGSSERSSLKSHQRKRFLLYNFYGWGLPILFTVITICLTNFDVLSDSLRPNFGQGRCWFQHDLSAAFFLGPIGVLILANLVFFVMTLKYCNKVKREIHRMQSSNEQKKVLRGNFFVDKAQFMMNTKLFVVMGITWVLELLSAIFYNRGRIFFWIVSDSFNVLLGVLVFLIFVFKKRVWQEVLQKLGFRSKPKPAFTTCVTQQTIVSSNPNRLKSLSTSTSLLNVNNINGNL